MSKKQNIEGWAKFPVGKTALTKKVEDVDLKLLVKDANSVLARGNGMSYGDVCFSPHNTIDFKTRNKLISFDENHEIIEWEAGALLSDINKVINPKGFKFYVIPGTKFITLGGAIACDVHGKNQPIYGAFCNHLVSFELLTSNGEIITCSKAENTDYFRATIGGVGLTGIILSAKIKVRKLTSNMMLASSKKVNTLSLLINEMENSKAEYKAAWIKKPSQILFTEADYIEGKEVPFKSSKTKVRFSLGGVFTSKLALKMVNNLLYISAKEGSFEKTEDKFLHPLDEIENWNKLYPKGFIQVQFLTSSLKIEQSINRTFNFIETNKLTTFLTTLKKFNNTPSQGMMSFVKEGYVFSIDIKYRKGLEKELLTLADEISDLGGRFYLAKDSFIEEKHLKEGYENYSKFKQFIAEKTQGKFKSSLSKRVNLHP